MTPLDARPFILFVNIFLSVGFHHAESILFLVNYIAIFLLYNISSLVIILICTLAKKMLSITLVYQSGNELS